MSGTASGAPQRQPIVAGNWKMNGDLASVRALLTALIDGAGASRAEIAVFPPFVYLAETARLLAPSGHQSRLSWGAQNVAEYAAGAYTGEVAATMLTDFGCRYALVGHSERRALFGESDAQVAAKFVAVQGAGLTPVLCLGETLDEREQAQTEAVVARQLDAVIAAIASPAALQRAVIAYEPVWAIGTGKTASPEQAQAVHAFIRGKIAQLDDKIARDLRILYGGSVKGANAKTLFTMPDIDGGLVGGASLDPAEFLTIVAACGD